MQTGGDVIEVANIPFEVDMDVDMAMEPEAPGWMDKLKAHQTLIKYVAAGLFFLMSFIMIIKPLARWLTSTPIEEIQMLEQLPQTIKELERRYAEADKEGSYTPTDRKPDQGESFRVYPVDEDMAERNINGCSL